MKRFHIFTDDWILFVFFEWNHIAYNTFYFRHFQTNELSKIPAFLSMYSTIKMQYYENDGDARDEKCQNVFLRFLYVFVYPCKQVWNALIHSLQYLDMSDGKLNESITIW